MSRVIPTRVMLLVGAPGSGKGTYASRLCKLPGFSHVAVGDLVRNEIRSQTRIGDVLKTHSERGQLAPDDVITDLMRAKITERVRAPGAECVVLDGYPRNEAQAHLLEGILEDAFGPGGRCSEQSNIDLVLQLVLREDLLLRKSVGRRVCRGCGHNYNLVCIDEPQTGIYMPAMLPKQEGACDHCGGELYTREDDQLEIVQQRLREYRQASRPVLRYYRDRGIIRQVNVNHSADVCAAAIIDTVKRELDLNQT